MPSKAGHNRFVLFETCALIPTSGWGDDSREIFSASAPLCFTRADRMLILATLRKTARERGAWR